MSEPTPLQRLRPSAAPLAVFLITAATVFVIPPLVLGQLTRRTFAITAAILTLALAGALPYAIVVGVGTLPLLYLGVASFAAPRPSRPKPHPVSVSAAIKHVVAGSLYTLAAASTGAIGIGAQFGGVTPGQALPSAFQPALLYLGGGVIAVTFVVLQWWRYETPLHDIPPATIASTTLFGVLIAGAPAVSFWVFGTLV